MVATIQKIAGNGWIIGKSRNGFVAVETYRTIHVGEKSVGGGGGSVVVLAAHGIIRQAVVYTVTHPTTPKYEVEKDDEQQEEGLNGNGETIMTDKYYRIKY